ncbi:MAG: hypothetical protein ACK4J0_01400 [Candidatus Anstonellaceae archaeon]
MTKFLFHKAFPSSASHSLKKGFREFHELLVENNFSLVPFFQILKPNELIYNRGISQTGEDNGKSNFFVFVKFKPLYFTLFFFNPDFSSRAIELKPTEIYIKLHITGFSSSEFEKAIKKINLYAEKKPTTSYFVLLHGHVGFINGINMLTNHYDDGLSDMLTILRQLMVHHYDIDASGMHNNFIQELYFYQYNLEQKAGIVKFPSVEVTIPINRKGANGPHENIWFGSIKEGLEYHKRFFRSRMGKYPPYATTKSIKKLLNYNKTLAKEKRAAFGIAHPAYFVNTSWLGRVAAGQWSLSALEEHVQENIQGIGAFNIDSYSFRELKSSNPSEMKYFMDLVEKWKTANSTYFNAVNMAWAQEMRQKYGVFPYADHDIHKYEDFSYGGSIQGLGKMLNVLHFPSLPLRTKKPSPQEMVELMHSKDRTEKIEAFIPYNPKTANLVSSRLHLAFKDLLKKNKVFLIKVLKTAPEIFKEIKDFILSRYY